VSLLVSAGIQLRTSSIIGVRGLFDGISGTWMRQMTYSVCRFWAYDESKKLLGAGISSTTLFVVFHFLICF
jgi:hypothetical protein